MIVTTSLSTKNKSRTRFEKQIKHILQRCFFTISPSTKNEIRSRPEKQVEGDLAAMFVTISPSTKQIRSRPEKQIEKDLAAFFYNNFISRSPERERERERERPSSCQPFFLFRFAYVCKIWLAERHRSSRRFPRLAQNVML